MSVASMCIALYNNKINIFNAVDIKLVTGKGFQGYLAGYPIFDRLFNNLVNIQK